MEMRKEDIKNVLLTMNAKELKELEEQAKEQRLSGVESEIKIISDDYKKLSANFNILNDNYTELKENNEILIEKVEVMQTSTNKVTDTLLTHGKEKRALDRFVSSLVYKTTIKDSLRDELFHGFLTSCCKKSICESLNVDAVQWIEVKDINMAEQLAMKFLNKTTIHTLMRKEAMRLDKQSLKSKKDNNKATIGKARKFELLELLIDEVGGDINEI